MEAGEAETARSFLVDFDLLYRFTQADFELLLLDSDAYCSKRPQDMTCRVVRNCLLQSKKGLAKDPRQLPFQLLSRISGIASDVRGDVEISNLLQACRGFKSKDFYWFRPIRASMPLIPETTLKVMRGHADTILSVSCSPLDSPLPKLALTGSCDGTAKMFDLQTGRCELTLNNQGGGYCSGVSLYVLSETCLVALTSTEDANSRVWYISKSPQGFFTCFSSDTSQVSFDPAHVLIGHDKELTECAFLPSSNARMAVTCSADCTAKLWELPLPFEPASVVPVCKQTYVGHEQPVLCCAFIPEEFELLATGSKDRTIRIWTLATGHCLSVFPGHFANVTCIAFRNDGVVFATGGWDSICKVWSVSEALNQQVVDPSANADVVTVEEKCMLVHKDWIWGVAFLETDRDLLATGADNGIVRLWSISSSTCVLAFDAHLGLGVYCLAPMGSDFIVTGGIDATLRMFDVSKQRCTGRNTVAESWTSAEAVHRHQSEVTCAAFPAQNLKKRICFLGSRDKTIRAFDLNNGRCVKKLPEKHKSGLQSILVSRNENSLRSVDDGGSVVVWNRATFDLKVGGNGLKAQLKSMLCGCFDPNSGWRQTGISFESEMRDGHLQIPQSLIDVLDISTEEEGLKPFIPLSFDTAQDLDCWCSPPQMPPDIVAEGEEYDMADAVLVIAEKNGLVHILHPMI